MNQLNVHSVLGIVWNANEREVCMHFLASFHFYLMPQIIEINLELKQRAKGYSTGTKALKALSILSTELLGSLSYPPVPI